MLIFVFGCNNPFDTNRTVKYKISGNCGIADITYTNSSGGTTNLDNVSLPWSVSIEANEGDWVYLSGWGWDGGTITASIYVNGSKVESETGTGDSYCYASVGLFLE